MVAYMGRRLFEIEHWLRTGHLMCFFKKKQPNFLTKLFFKKKQQETEGILKLTSPFDVAIVGNFIDEGHCFCTVALGE